MKCTIPEISWHNRDPVFSVDIQKKDDKESFYRLASGGTDSHVLMWHISLQEDGTLKLDCVCDLTRHQKAVNVVRFSPCGKYLASADDECVIIIWRRKTNEDKEAIFDDNSKENVEQWIQDKTLRGHINDIYDLSWSPDSSNIISGSVDNTAIVWDISKGKKLKILDEHKNFVQGVAWDPKNQFIATSSSDSFCRIFNAKTYQTVAKMSKTKWTVGNVNGDEVKPSRLFYDDTLKTFFRRLTWTPDGLLLIAPAGILDQPDSKPLQVTWVFPRNHLSKPVLYYPMCNSSSTVVRCCPCLFELRQGESSVFSLPYRVVIAVAAKASILLYDTQHAVPIGLISNIHYTKLTDLTWSDDGRILVASSTDGYCSFVTFAEGELGTPYNQDITVKAETLSTDIS